MKASKQHFELVERVLRNMRRTLDVTPDLSVLETLDALTLDFASAFEANNKAGFDRARFLKGCGYIHATPHTAPRDPRPTAQQPTPVATALVTAIHPSRHVDSQLRGSDVWQHIPINCPRCGLERKAQEVLDAHGIRTS